MKIIKKPCVVVPQIEGVQLLRKIERYGRACYKSEDRINEDSYLKFIPMILERGHESMFEHEKITVRIICDRGVSHEIVRHRIAAYSQESTRYCNYSQDKFGNEITVIEPFFFDQSPQAYKIWYDAMRAAETRYFMLLDAGASPQEARSVLPNSLKTEIVVTYNLREWRHFFSLRAARDAHLQMQQIAIPLLRHFQKEIPFVFVDINYNWGFKERHYAEIIVKEEI